MMPSMLIDHFRSRESTEPRNLNDSTTETVLPRTESGSIQGGCFRKSTTISTVFCGLSTKLLLLHHATRCSTSHLYADSSPFLISPMTVVSSANFRILTEGFVEIQSFVYKEKSSGESTHPWGAPILTVRIFDVVFPSLTCCFLFIRKLCIHL